jgi:hypothetical protein
MGSRKLRKKILLHYRKAKAKEIAQRQCCWYCSCLVWAEITYPTGVKSCDWRCKKIGLGSDTRYSISAQTGICDAFTAAADYARHDKLRGVSCGQSF